MTYIMFEAMETEENAIFALKSTILDGRQENVEKNHLSPGLGIGRGWAQQQQVFHTNIFAISYLKLVGIHSIV